MPTFARWLTTPENCSATLAVRRVAECLGARKLRRAVNPLFLHGPSGTGKTHLVSALVTEVIRANPDVAVEVGSANDWQEAPPDARECALLVVEDLQHLPASRAEALVQAFDGRLGREQQMVFTATVGPRQLTQLPARLTSRLACGLVSGLEPLAPASRTAFLEAEARRRGLALGRDVLDWLSRHVGGSGRQLEGALNRLETLGRLQGALQDATAVAVHFRAEAEAARTTVEQIAERVSCYFQVPPRELQSRRRCRSALLPRQVGMYLARQLTPLSLDQIGAYFGGRDHSTVLHACRKVEHALDQDHVLSGAVRQLHADLR